VSNPKVAVLGCSFSDAKYHYDIKSWSHYLAADNPHIDVVNFAVSAHGFDYNLFVLNWMVYTRYCPDLVIMNIPPLNRKFEWNDTTGDFSSVTDTQQLYQINQVQDNLYTARPTVPRIVYSSNGIGYFDDGCTITPQEFTRLQQENVVSLHRYVMNDKLMAVNYISSIKLLSEYEKLLGCKIYYYTFEEYKHYSRFFTNTNFSKKELPADFIPHNYTDTLLPDGHFTSLGNELFYNIFVKDDPNIYKDIRNLV
jgi:hypothetical protein